jgi:uncharacterized membrane protein
VASSYLIAVGYEREETAEQALASVRDLAQEHALELKDAAIVVKDAADRVELRQTRELAGGGGLAVFDRGISDKRMRSIGAELEPGHAALFALVADVDWALLHERLSAYGGEVAASELDDEVVAALEPGSTGP